MCFSKPKSAAPQALPPPVTSSAAQVQDASDQERRAALLRRGQNQSLFGGAGNQGELGQGQAGGQPLKGMLG